MGIYESKEEFLRLKDFLEKDLFYRLKEAGNDCFEFSVESNQMRENILGMFQEKSIQSEKEYSFRILPESSSHNLAPT